MRVELTEAVSLDGRIVSTTIRYRRPKASKPMGGEELAAFLEDRSRRDLPDEGDKVVESPDEDEEDDVEEDEEEEDECRCHEEDEDDTDDDDDDDDDDDERIEEAGRVRRADLGRWLLG
jgi:hypothetical protein